MRVDAIRSFLKLVELGSYAAAADALFMSPTTLHSHVKSLEDELATTLVSFEGRRMDLTRAGSRFMIFAQQTINEYDAIRDELSGIVRKSQAVLRIACLHAPGTYLLPPVIIAFQAAHPDVHVVVEARRTGEALAAVVSRQADIAIVHDAHAEHARDVFETSLLYEDRLAAIIRKDLYTAPDVALMSKYPLAVQPVDNLSRQYVERWARHHNIDVRAAYEHSAFDGILAHVLSTDCIGILGGYVIAHSPIASLVQMLDLPEFNNIRRIVALYPARASETVAQFVHFFRRFYDVGVLTGP